MLKIMQVLDDYKKDVLHTSSIDRLEQNIQFLLMHWKPMYTRYSEYLVVCKKENLCVQGVCSTCTKAIKIIKVINNEGDYCY